MNKEMSNEERKTKIVKAIMKAETINSALIVIEGNPMIQIGMGTPIDLISDIAIAIKRVSELSELSPEGICNCLTNTLKDISEEKE